MSNKATADSVTVKKGQAGVILATPLLYLHNEFPRSYGDITFPFAHYS